MRGRGRGGGGGLRGRGRGGGGVERKRERGGGGLGGGRVWTSLLVLPCSTFSRPGSPQFFPPRMLDSSVSTMIIDWCCLSRPPISQPSTHPWSPSVPFP